MPKKHNHQTRAWVVAANMGYGHMRAAYPLLELAGPNREYYVIANDYEGIPESDKKIWHESRVFYETISRMEQLPMVGNAIFSILDKWQEIPPFYPRRDLSEATVQVKQMYALFRKGFNKAIVEKFETEPKLPIVTTFNIPALACDYYGCQNDVYCIITDTDFSRLWCPLEPKKTKLKYIAPNVRVAERLKQYGIPDKNIFLTGFPLPKENIGGINKLQIKKDLGRRIANLDPQGNYLRHFGPSVRKLLGTNLKNTSDHPLTLMFAVGGAGAQREMASEMLKSLKMSIRNKKLRLILVAGSRQDVFDYFGKTIKTLGMQKEVGKGLEVLFNPDKNEYFAEFNQALHDADILWTKPSELSFYAGLGIPIIIADPIGSQEDFNEFWLRALAAGIPQDDIRYTDQWLFDWLDSGWLARAAVNGFVGAPKRGTYRIEEIVAHKKQVMPEPVEPI